MRQWLTGEDLVNWLVMLRTSDSRTYLVLEGPTDCQALDPHIAADAALSFPAHSKSVATRAIEIVDQRGLKRILAILDRDWVDMLTPAIASNNVVYTDMHDLDATIAFAGAVLDRVIVAHSNRDARVAHLQSTGRGATELVAFIACTVGVLRLVSERDRLGISCRDFPVQETLSAAHDGVDLHRLAVVAVGRSEHTIVSETDLVARIEAELPGVLEPRRICDGHDVAMTVSTLVRYWGGTGSRTVIEQAMRSALSCAELQLTSLFDDVTAWSQRAGATVWSCA